MSFQIQPIRTGSVILLFTLLMVFPGCRPISRIPAPHPPAPPAPPSVPTVLHSVAQPVLLIQASSSVPDPAERTYARRMAAKLAGWLREAGIPVTLADDGTAAKSITRDTRVVILYANQTLASEELRALTRFVERNGKLLIFHAADPRLATLMGLKVSPRILATRPGQWSAFRFTANPPPGTPSRIEQDSLGLRPVHPTAPSSSIMAWWEDSTGRRAPEPAWVRSQHGFWMSHILQEGDIPAKKQMLIALLGACDPDLPKVAAEQAMAAAGTLNRFPNSAQARSAIEQQSNPLPANPKVTALLAQAQQLETGITHLYRTGHYDQVITSARLLDAAIMEAYSRTATPRDGEFRGAWNHSGTGLYPGNWEDSCRTLAENGITALFPHMQRPWTAHYASRLLPASPVVATLGDQLTACLPAAKRHGIEVHAWVICWNMDGAPASLLAAYRREGRLQVSAKGEPLDWLCPSDPRNRAFQLDIIRDLATRYPVAGIHLDYIRYYSREYCYCSGCRQRFARATGASIRHWPADVRSGPRAEAFARWRRDQITDWLADVRQTLHHATPTVRLSAAVYPGYPGCRDSIGQDWGEWARRDLVDFICPMNYTDKTGQFAQWCRTQSTFAGVRNKLLPGIGVTANESRLDAAGVIDQINALRRESLPGFMLFDANRTLEKDILPYLRMGATANTR